MREVRKSILGYMAVDEKLKKDILDDKLVRGIFDRSNHYAKIRIRYRWEYGKSNNDDGKVNKAIASERMDWKVIRVESEIRVCETK